MYYSEYANLRNTPGRLVEPETDEEVLALFDEVADALLDFRSFEKVCKGSRYLEMAREA